MQYSFTSLKCLSTTTYHIHKLTYIVGNNIQHGMDNIIKSNTHLIENCITHTIYINTSTITLNSIHIVGMTMYKPQLNMPIMSDMGYK